MYMCIYNIHLYTHIMSSSSSSFSFHTTRPLLMRLLIDFYLLYIGNTFTCIYIVYYTSARIRVTTIGVVICNYRCQYSYIIHNGRRWTRELQKSILTFRGGRRRLVQTTKPSIRIYVGNIRIRFYLLSFINIYPTSVSVRVLITVVVLC